MHSNPYQSLVTLISNISEAYTTALFLVNHKKRELSLAASQSLSKYLAESIVLPLDQSGILSQVHKVGHIIHLDKLQETPLVLSSALPFYREGESHIKGVFALPVGDGLGVLYVDTKHSWGFNDKQQKLIAEIAEVLHDLLKRQESIEQQRDYARILNLWHQIDQTTFENQSLEDHSRLILTECTRFLDAEYGFLALKEPRKHHYRLLASTSNIPRNLATQRLPVKQGLIGWIFQNQKNLLISRLNPHSPDHFLCVPSEGLPHHGTFWGLPARISLGHRIVLAFMSRGILEWSADEQFAISHSLHFLRLLLDQFYCHETCEHLQTYDFHTGLYNAVTFVSRFEEVLSSSMQNSTPFTMSLVQFEPWQVLSTKAPPKETRQWQAELASSVYDALPQDAFIGQIAENRFAILFLGITSQEAEHHISNLRGVGQRILSAHKVRGSQLLPFVGSVGFPQDATRSDELWRLAYRRLFSAFHTKVEEPNP